MEARLDPSLQVTYSWVKKTGIQTTSCVLSRFSHVQLCATLWTEACQAPLSIGFSRQEYWRGLSCLPPGDLPDPAIFYVSCSSRRVLYHKWEGDLAMREQLKDCKRQPTPYLLTPHLTYWPHILLTDPTRNRHSKAQKKKKAPREICRFGLHTNFKTPGCQDAL